MRVSKLYYLENKTQAEIAKMLKVSRPLVSRMLDEARKEGIVEMRIHSENTDDRSISALLKQKYGIQGGRYTKEQNSDSRSDWKGSLVSC